MKTRELTRAEVTFEVSIEPDDTPVVGNFASGDDALDREDENRILERLKRGETEAWCGVIVTARWKGFKATDSVWGVELGPDETPEHYAEESGMHEEALAHLNEKVARTARKLARLVVA